MQLVVDWDGTVTETDSLWMALDRFGDPEVFARVEGRLLAGTISFREVMELEFASVTAPLAEVVAFLADEVRIRPGFAELAAAERPLVLSAGFHELIEPLLAREGVAVELRANRLEVAGSITGGAGDARPEDRDAEASQERVQGWRVLWRDPEPCPVCGDLCKRRTLPPGPLAYVGDGYSDRCAALAADRIFARDGLAEWLTGEGVPFEPFADFYDVAAALRRDRAGAGGPDEPRTRTTGRK